jgi:Bacterial Ig-like domain/Planctomycete cytochrome C
VIPRRLEALSFCLLAAGLASCNSKLEVNAVNRFNAGTPGALQVVLVSPGQGASGVRPDVQVEVTFSRALGDASAANAAAITIEPVGCPRPVPGDVAVDPDRRRLVFRPATPLETPGVLYRVHLDPALRAADGGALEDEFSFEFTTAALDLSPPAFAGVSSASPVSAQTLRVQWPAAVDAASPSQVLTYRVYRAPAPGPLSFSAPALETSAGATEALLTGLDPDTTYLVAVRVVDSACNEDSNTGVVAARTQAERDVVPPVFAGARGARATSAATVEVEWGPATDNRDAASDIRFRIYHAASPGAYDFRSPAATFQGAASGEVSGLAADSDHFFVVRAMDTTDNEDTNAVEVSARTPAVAVSFASQVLPVLAAHCAISGCHNAGSHQAGLNLSTYAGLMDQRVPRDAPTVVPGNSAGSLLIWRTDSRNQKYQEFAAKVPAWRMPPEPRAALTNDSLDLIIRWIDAGAQNN